MDISHGNDGKRIAHVFARRTNASPTDDLAFFNVPGLFPIDVDAVHVSVTFSWDLPRVKMLADAWRSVAPVTSGGPATGMAGNDFVPGMYLKPGYVITSRGCPNRCWFCSVPGREGALRELPITEGHNVLDDNLLAYSEPHIRTVFAMLGKQRMGPVRLTSGLEAARLKDWHIDLIHAVKPHSLFFAYDTEDDFEPLVVAARKLWNSGFKPRGKRVRAYVLIGYPGDSLANAEKRLKATLKLGVVPMAMFFRKDTKPITQEWQAFKKPWMRPAMIRLPCTL